MNPHSTFFTADLHFGHEKVIEHDSPWPGREKFKTIDEHDAAVVAAINAVVREHDTLYILGDFAFRCALPVYSYRYRLACRNIVLIPGNHDPGFAITNGDEGLWQVWKREKHEVLANCDDRVGRTIEEIKVLGQRIVLCHYPLLRWPESHKGAWHLHGHTHGCVASEEGSLDVGINVWGSPLSYADVAWHLRDFSALAHHTSQLSTKYRTADAEEAELFIATSEEENK